MPADETVTAPPLTDTLSNVVTVVASSPKSSLPNSVPVSAEFSFTAKVSFTASGNLSTLATFTVTVAVLVSPSASVMVYVKVSAPTKPATGE